MLDAFIIDEIVKRQSRIDEDDARPAIQIPVPEPVDDNPPQIEPVEDEPKVIIIDI